MNNGKKRNIKSIGKIILGVGLLCLLIGIIFFAFTVSTFSLWLIVASVVINIAGITLMTTKLEK